MLNLKCGKKSFEDGYECPSCGNHVCGECAKKTGGLCPFCYGQLYRIS